MNKWATVARCGSVGDNMMAASCLPHLKQQGYMVEVLTALPNHVVFHHNPYVDKLTVIDLKKDLPSEDTPVAYQQWFQRRGLEAQHFVHLQHSCELKHCLLPEQAAFWASDSYRREFCKGSYLETIHKLAGAPMQFGTPLFYEFDTEREMALRTREQIGGKIIGWVLTGSRIDRRYPNTATAIARLIRELDVSVLITGVPTVDAFEDAKKIMAEVTKQNGSDQGFVLATSPDTTLTWGLRRSLSQLMHCDAVISPDTGPAWAVAMSDVPKVMLLSNSSAENVTKHWRNTITLHADQARVPCYPCHRLHIDKSTCEPNVDDTGAKCISDITVECLIAATRVALSQNMQGHRTALHSKFATNIAGALNGAHVEQRTARLDHSGSDGGHYRGLDVVGPLSVDPDVGPGREWKLEHPVRVLPPSSTDGRIRIATGNRVVLEVVSGDFEFADQVAERLNAKSA